MQVEDTSAELEELDEMEEQEELEELEEERDSDYVWLELGEDGEDGEGLHVGVEGLLEDDGDDLLEDEGDDEEEEEDDEDNNEEFEYFLSLELMEKMERMKLFNLSTEAVAEGQEALVLAMVGEEEEEEFAALDEELDQMLDELQVEEDLIEEALDTLDTEDAPPDGAGQGGAAPSPLEPGHALHSALLWGSLAAALVLACLALAATYRCSRDYSKVASTSTLA